MAVRVAASLSTHHHALGMPCGQRVGTTVVDQAHARIVALPSDPDASHPADTGNMLDRHGHRVVFCTIAFPTGSVFMVRSGR